MSSLFILLDAETRSDDGYARKAERRTTLVTEWRSRLRAVAWKTGAKREEGKALNVPVRPLGATTS